MTGQAFHVAVWIDHEAAQLYSVTREHAEEIALIRAPDQGGAHIHHKAGTPGAGHVSTSQDFLRQVADRLREAGSILILGPAEAKHALRAFLDARHPDLAGKVVGVQAMPRAEASTVHALAKPLFHRADRMRAGNWQ